MPRRLRLEYEGAIYHLMNRGDRREPIYLDDTDRQQFIHTLGQACEKTGWQVHAFCLMKNHFHLVTETPRANLVSGMRWFLGTYTARFNRRHKYSGHLFSGRYKSTIVDGSGTGYLKAVCDYVHLNPVRARLVKPEEALAAYRWSSWPEYLKPPAKRLAWLRVDRFMGEWGIQGDHPAGRRQLSRSMEERRKLEEARENSDWKQLRRGWCWGSESFRDKLLGKIELEQGGQHYGKELRESDEQMAERLVREMLREAGWTEEALKRRGKSDARKSKMAANLRAQTTMTWRWISNRLHMGHWRTAANAVRLAV
ncbi:MAG: REP-associated tyrosine transposase [Verrucomicrobiota bacterium]|jgi:REP element-mobilizing transposase RayT